MEPFRRHVGTAMPLPVSNVDTDQLIPVRFLKRLTRNGYADALFAGWRDDPGFVLNRQEYRGATILIAGPEFGTGSSREHAVWALRDHGFRVVISPRFADIFRGNSLKNGLLTVELPAAQVATLLDTVSGAPDTEITVDLVDRQVRTADEVFDFTLDEPSRRRLLDGQDEIEATLVHAAEVDAFERRRPAFLPTLGDRRSADRLARQSAQ